MKTEAKPRRYRGRYCSSWCGHGCTWDEHQEAKKKAEALAKELGPQWEPEVWENLGWHYCARISEDIQVTVQPSAFRKEYLAFLHHRHTAIGPTPKAALNNALEVARAERDTVNSIVALVEGTVA